MSAFSPILPSSTQPPSAPPERIISGLGWPQQALIDTLDMDYSGTWTFGSQRLLQPILNGPLLCWLVEVQCQRLIRVHKVSITKKGVSNAVSNPGKANPACCLYTLIPRVLQQVNPAINWSPVLDLIIEALIAGGYHDGVKPTDKAVVFSQPDPANLAEAALFIQNIKECIFSCEFQSQWQFRVDQLRIRYEAMTKLTDCLLVSSGSFFCVPMDLCLDQSPWAHAHLTPGDPNTNLKAVIDVRSRFLGSQRFRKAYKEHCLGYISHVEYNCQRGFYIRILFFLRNEGLGVPERFTASITKLWRRLAHPLGLCVPLAKSNNWLSSMGANLVESNKPASITHMEKFLSYMVLKDQYMRVKAGKFAHIFTRSELPEISDAAFRRAFNLASQPCKEVKNQRKSPQPALLLRVAPKEKPAPEPTDPFANIPLRYPIMPERNNRERLKRVYVATKMPRVINHEPKK